MEEEWKVKGNTLLSALFLLWLLLELTELLFDSRIKKYRYTMPVILVNSLVIWR